MPNDYDRIIKENFEPLLPHLCRVLLGLDLSHMEPMEAKIQVTIERELDHLKKVIHLILQNLLKIVGRVERLKKYQRQLQILSRLRKLQPIVLKEISLMPIKFDIETDELYLEGIEKGIEKGLEKGVEKHQHETVVAMLRDGALSLEKIAEYAGVTLEYVLKVKKELESEAKRNN